MTGPDPKGHTYELFAKAPYQGVRGRARRRVWGAEPFRAVVWMTLYQNEERSPNFWRWPGWSVRVMRMPVPLRRWPSAFRPGASVGIDWSRRRSARPVPEA